MNVQEPAGGAPRDGGPLRLTTARWLNRRRQASDHDGQPSERWSKVLAHKGSYDQFAYGTDTASDWQGPLQRAVICSPWSGVIAVDIDDEAAYMTTRTARTIARADAWSTRGGGFHVLIDARSVPPQGWPKPVPVAGADIKSCGFVPMPGSEHYSGELYEPVFRPDGLVTVVTAKPDLIEAIHADQSDEAERRRASGLAGARTAGAGNGGGHDGEVAAETMGICLRLLRSGMTPGDELREAAYAAWLTVAVPRDPSWPYDRGDFERHYAGALYKAQKLIAADLPVTDDMVRWATDQTTGVQAAARVRAWTWRDAEAVNAKWLHDTDPVPTRIVLAAYAANMALPGDPVWVMLVGGSGIGKTERILPVASMPHVVMASTLTGEAPLLSASPKRERAANATGGILRQIGERGVLVIKDFTSVLSMSRDRRAEVVAALREVYDGRWDRHYGTDGGQVLTWQGHCGFIAGTTTAIDGAHAVLDQMGTRFLFVRLPDADHDRIGRSALAHAGQEDRMRAELAEATTGLLGNLGRPHEIHEGVREWLIPLASLASQARSPVERDYHGEIALVLDAEAPTRIIKQLGQLWRACGMLGLGEAESWAAVRRAGLDSIPKLRRAVITCLGSQDGTWQPTTEVAKAVGHPSRTTRRSLEDLNAHGIVVRNDEQHGYDRKIYSWALSPQALTWWNAVNR